MGEQLGPSSDELEPVQSVSREVLLTEEPLDTELPPEGVVLRPPLPRAIRASRSRRFTGGGGVAGAARRGCGGIW